MRVVVVGDKKSPDVYDINNVHFLSCAAQNDMGSRLSAKLPYNHYCRKMMGYIHAIREGAEIIVDTDDDNIPIDSWCIDGFSGVYPTIKEDKGFINIYELYTDVKVWPRGLPLRLINKKTIEKCDLHEGAAEVGVWQGLADNEPDVDAIYRLTDGKLIKFKSFGKVVLSYGTLSPFNSQNTIIRRELFPLLYLPSTVTFRFTDILRGFVAQPIMWASGFKLGFTDANVIQERNKHNLSKDFESEVPMYLHTEKIIEICCRTVTSGASVTDNLFNCYVSLVQASIVGDAELEILETWLKDAT